MRLAWHSHTLTNRPKTKKVHRLRLLSLIACFFFFNKKSEREFKKDNKYSLSNSLPISLSTFKQFDTISSMILYVLCVCLCCWCMCLSFYCVNWYWVDGNLGGFLILLVSSLFFSLGYICPILWLFHRKIQKICHQMNRK